jgi:hypothetical protein
VDSKFCSSGPRLDNQVGGLIAAMVKRFVQSSGVATCFGVRDGYPQRPRLTEIINLKKT